MIRFRDLLVENPDTLRYQKKYYYYISSDNKSAFFIYKDEKTLGDELFGYSADKKEFYSSVPEVLIEIEELKNKEVNLNEFDNRTETDERALFWAKNDIERLNNSNNGGGHLQLKNILTALNRILYGDTILKGRIFKVDDGNIVVTFWEWNIEKIAKYKRQIDQAVEFNGYKPTECLYEAGSSIISYDTLYASQKTEISPNLDIDLGTPKPVTEPIKVGDTVTFSQYDSTLRAKVIKIGELTVNLKTIVPGDGMKVGDEFMFALPLLKKVKETGDDIQKMYDDKMDTFVTKSGELHTRGATLTPQEKENLQREVDTLELETKKLKMFIDSGITVLTPERKTELETYVNHELKKKHAEKKDRYSLIKQAEKQYGMPIAQLRQKFRGVPLDQLVQKESLYKKLLKALKG